MGKKFWFKLDKDKIKLQLKTLGKRVSLKSKGQRKAFLLIFLLMVIGGISFALYTADNSNYNPEDNIDVNITPAEENSFVESGLKEKEDKETNFSLNYNKLSDSREKDKTASSNNTETTSDKEEIVGVVTEPVKPVHDVGQREEISLLKPVSGNILQGTGWHYHPVFQDWRYQHGIQFDGRSGDVVMAAADGRVVSVKNDDYLGITVVLEHASGWRTYYGHLQKTTINRGEEIARGQEVGRLGSTGFTDQPSLYFALSNGEGDFLNPIEYIE